MHLYLAATALFFTGALAACSRDFLRNATTALLNAQLVGKPGFLPLAPTVAYSENDTPLNISAGLLAQPITIDFNRSLYDTTQCATFTELIAASNKHPYVIMTRMVFAEQQATTVQSVVADAGDWLFNATSSLQWSKSENWDTIPEDKRDSRAVIQAAGDKYLDNWGNYSIQVPYGTPCARLEGGLYTGEQNLTANTCTMGQFPEPLAIERRRYVIDEEVGAVNIFNNFPFIDIARPNGTASTNLFRVEGGMIRYIHEVTICSEDNCGR